MGLCAGASREVLGSADPARQALEAPEDHRGSRCRAVTWLPARQTPSAEASTSGPCLPAAFHGLALICRFLLGVPSLKEHVEPGPVIHTVGSSVSEGKRPERACCARHEAGRGWAKLGLGLRGLR